MVYESKFGRVLHLKEREKDEAMSLYQETVKKFEEAAEKLYELLKKKEDIVEHQSARMLNGLSVQEIRHHQLFLDNLEKTINHHQKMVINARNRMNLYQEKLMNKNIEVRKIEKIHEKDRSQFFQELKIVESKQMDDISIQHYMNRGS
ncbi:flagellar export protein FliJ [Bacillus dakarensis]|uniref:flagellar export protein FliJ n=1 Tax=Robertmurraya dakarensis TaxID=1926278 RepID=UPI00098200DF|nr:flagellar export protein FliJ [Bacillus dakarensis]